MKKVIFLAMVLMILSVLFAACDYLDIPFGVVDNTENFSETTGVAPIETESDTAEATLGVTDPVVTEPSDTISRETDDPGSVPAETAPAATEPDDTAPAETAPAATEPDDTAPAETAPAATEPDDTAPAETAPAATEPDDTAPVETAPAATEPADTAPVETAPVEVETTHRHAWGEWIVTKKATCRETGVKERSCACGEKETRSIQTTSHTKVVDSVVAPTCSDNGYTRYVCSVCGEDENREFVSALGHNYVQYECTRCGEAQYSSGLRFDSYGSGTCYLSGIGLCRDNDIIIPTDASKGCQVSVNGVVITPTQGLVVKIGISAFSGCSDLTSVYIPDCIYSIDDYAFENCVSLKSIHIPESIRFMGHDVFKGCDNLPIVTDEYGVQYLDDWVIGFDGSSTEVIIREGTRGIAGRAFYQCTNLTRLVLPASLVSICSDAFKGCKNLKTVYYNGSVEQWCSVMVQNVYSAPCCNGADFYIQGKRLEGELGIPNGVTEIDYFAFAYCKDLTNVIIPNSVTTIDCGAFYECDGLTRVEVPTSVTFLGNWAFGSCDNLTEISLPEGLSHIGEDAFYYCGNLTGIVIPDSVTFIGEYAFFGCQKLTFIRVPDRVTSLEYATFGNCTGLISVKLPAGLTSIGTGAFYKCTSLLSIEIPGSVTSIGENAFEGCTQLMSVQISRGVISIGSKAFKGCTGLVSIEIPEGVTSIEAYAFDGCSGLKSIEIPNSVTKIGTYAFFGCAGLTTIEIPMSVTEIGDNAFGSCWNVSNVIISKNSQLTTIGESAFMNCSSLINMNIPFGVTEIKSYAFSGCTSLSNVTLPASITTIRSYTFKRCRSLRSVEIPTGVTGIGAGAFSSCSGLASITIPDSVTFFGEDAFRMCTNLTDIYYTGTDYEWSGITKYNWWNLGMGSYTVHYNYFVLSDFLGANYGIVMDFDTVFLPASKKDIFLVPLYGYGEFKITNHSTEEILPWGTSGFHFEIKDAIGSFTIDEYGTLVGKKSGIAYVSIYYLADGQKLYMLEDQPVFVAESSFENGSHAEFSDSDKEYISMCLDLTYTLPNVQPPSLPDLGIFHIDNVWNNVSNLTANLAAALREGVKFNPEKEEIKRNLATIISKYAGQGNSETDQQSQMIKEIALNNADMVMTLINALADLEENHIDEYNKLSEEEKRLYQAFVEVAKKESIESCRKDIETVSNFLNAFLQHDDATGIIQAITDWNSAEEVQSAFQSVRALNDLVNEYKSFDRIVGVLGEMGAVTLDAVMYTMCDYQANLDLLLLLREEFSKSYSSDEVLIAAIDSLIDDYSNKWATAANQWISQIGAMTILDMAELIIRYAFPNFSIVKFVVESFADCSYAQEKSQLYTLSLMSSALYDSLDPLYDMYMNGRQTVSIERLKTVVSLYLNLVKDENDLAWSLWFDYSMDEISKFGQTSNYIESSLGIYLN